MKNEELNSKLAFAQKRIERLEAAQTELAEVERLQSELNATLISGFHLDVT